MQLSNNIQRMLRERCTHETRPGGTRVPYGFRKELSGLLSTLSFRWDSRHLCWNVVCRPLNKMPYIILQVKNATGGYRDVGSDILTQIRRSMWWSAKGIVRQARKMENEEGYARERLDNDRKEKSKDFAKEMAYPIMAEMRGIDYNSGNSHFQFRGYSEE